MARPGKAEGDGAASRWALGARATAGFGLALLFVAAACAFSYRELTGLEASGGWVLHAQTVRTEIEELSAALGEAEAEQRGYLLTGAEGHRRAFRSAAGRAADRLTTLRALTADNPSQQGRLRELAPLVAERLRALDELAAAHRPGAAAGPALAARVEEGSRRAREARRLLRQMGDEEGRLLADRAADAAARSRATHAGLAVAGTCGLALLLLTVLLLNRALVQRRRAEAERRVRERTEALARTNAELRAEIASHEQTGAALRRSEQLYRRVVEASQEGVWVVDADGRTTFANARLAQMLGCGRDELLARPVYDFVGDAERGAAEVAAERCRRGAAEQFDFKFRRPDGSDLWALVSTTPLTDPDGACTGALGMLTDLTDRRRLEEQFLQAQKMEAVGRLAGGVAHDFNNLLTVILSYGELLRGRLADPEDLGMVEEITRAVGQAGSLTRQLLAFGRKGVVQPRVLDLGAAVAQTQKMLRRLIGEDVELAVTRAPGPAPVKADPGQLEQVLLNLAINARDAMPQGGRLTVEVQVVELDGAYAATHLRVRPGAFALLAVSDTGCGMDAATQARAFEPFFTTKGEKGTGLGLATVYGIVEQAGGHVTVYSEVARGTTFKVYLPLAAAGAEAPEVRPPAGPPPGGSETVLLAEDEGVVRTLARKVLEGHGYTVLEAGDGREALRLAALHAGPVHLLLTDLVMPGACGREVAERLRDLRPGLRVLYMSGYTDDAVVRHGVLEAEADFLQKPFTPEALARKVREVLSRQ
jgi:PAS domain S-box-containing protein